MNERELLMQIEVLKSQLRELDEERTLTLRLEDLKRAHRTLKSPDSEIILFLIRKLFLARDENNRLKKRINDREASANQRARSISSRVEQVI